MACMGSSGLDSLSFSGVQAESWGEQVSPHSEGVRCFCEVAGQNIQKWGKIKIAFCLQIVIRELDLWKGF